VITGKADSGDLCSGRNVERYFKPDPRGRRGRMELVLCLLSEKKKEREGGKT